jgi:hypothetical protein
MSKKTFFVALLAVLLFACDTGSKRNNIEVKRIQYDVPIKNSDPDALWWSGNLEGSVRENLLRTFFEKVYSGEIEVYDYFHQYLTPEQAKNVGTDTVYQTLRRESPPYDVYDTIVIHTISYRDIATIRFLEEWKIDKNTMEVEKRILGMAPVFERKYGSETYKQLLFWTYFDDQYPDLLRNK